MIFILQLNETIIDKIFNYIFGIYAQQYFTIFIEFIFSLCIVFLIGGIVYFLKSIREVSRLIGVIYKNKSKLTNEDVNNIEAALKKPVLREQSYDEEENIFRNE